MHEEGSERRRGRTDRPVARTPRTQASGGRDRTQLREARRPTREPLDFVLLGELTGSGTLGMGFDPRNSPESIARRLGSSPATVRRRLAQWRSRGFLLGFDVLPHPTLLGGYLGSRILEFQDPVAQERAIGPLSRIDGVVQIDPGRSTLLAVYLVDSVGQAERRLHQFRDLDGTQAIGPEIRFNFLPCTRRMSRSDWRLVRALRESPEAGRAELAKSVGQSTRTTSRRLESLLNDCALLFDPILDFSRYYQSLAGLAVAVERPELRGEVGREIRRLHPSSMFSWGLGLPDPKGGEAVTVHLWVTSPTAAELDRLPARVAQIPGVRQVWLWYGQSVLPVGAWLDERIEMMLKFGGPAQ